MDRTQHTGFFWQRKMFFNDAHGHLSGIKFWWSSCLLGVDTTTSLSPSLSPAYRRQWSSTLFSGGSRSEVKKSRGTWTSSGCCFCRCCCLAAESFWIQAEAQQHPHNWVAPEQCTTLAGTINSPMNPTRPGSGSSFDSAMATLDDSRQITNKQ